ncbi:QRFP-like peptide receptor [Montipora foliosa]|uniref:QRFP-like peptide receptor n=1 Tax=Montipora foliosa TaxID=591990 RepID=UPI0035F1C709
MNTTINGSEICYVHYNPTTDKIGATVAYCLIFVVSLVGNSCIGIIVYKTRTLRKPINIFVVNMAMSDLLVRLIYIPLKVVNLYRYSWLISGVLGSALCKLIPFLSEISYIVSVLSLILIAVGRFGAVVWPLHSPLISLKKCTLLILATWIVAMASASPGLFAYTLEKYEGGVFCLYQWEEAFGESASLTDYGLAYYIVFVYTPIILLIIIYSTILIKLKLQKTPGQQSTDAEIQLNKRNTNALKLAIAILVKRRIRRGAEGSNMEIYETKKRHHLVNFKLIIIQEQGEGADDKPEQLVQVPVNMDTTINGSVSCSFYTNPTAYNIGAKASCSSPKKVTRHFAIDERNEWLRLGGRGSS